MKFIYFGTGQYSSKVLEVLYKGGLIPQLVVTQPDRIKGRGLKLLPSPVAIFAQENNLTTIKPESLKDPAALEKLRSFASDLFIVADYGNILTSEVLKIPKLFSLGVHPSLLPKYRGATPLESVLLDGNKETAVTIFKIAQRVDSGEILKQKVIPINDKENIITLSEKLAVSGGELLIEGLKAINDGKYNFIPQDDTQATFTKKLTKADGAIIWSKDALTIYNFVKATLVWPTAFTYYKTTRLTLLEVEVVNREISAKPGEIIDIDNSGIVVATAKAAIRILKLKPEGKNAMPAQAFVCGYRVNIKDSLNEGK